MIVLIIKLMLSPQQLRFSHSFLFVMNMSILTVYPPVINMLKIAFFRRNHTVQHSGADKFIQSPITQAAI